MKRLMTVSAGVILSVTVASGGLGAADKAKAAPTFNADVAPILYRSCSGCHRPNQIAPMSLLSYQDTRPWAKAIRTKVHARQMPPWFADPRFGKFANDKSLTQAEIDTIVAWADAGAPQGTGSAPPLPHFSEAGWSHPSGRDPDLVIELPLEWKVMPEGEMPNFNLYSPLPFKEAKLVEAIQVRAGNIAATHHITLAAQNLPPGMALGTGPAWPGGPITTNVLVAAEKGTAVDNSGDATEEDAADEEEGAGSSIGAYIPGASARVARPGVAKWIRGDRYKYIRWNLHYQATGRPETARPSIGIWWQTSEVSNVERGSRFENQTSEGKPLIAPAGAKRLGLNKLLSPIPPNDGSWTVTGIAAIQDDVTVLGFGVHMHLRGREMTYVATYPDGRQEVLLRVPKYNFEWQLPYELETPVRLPAGSTVKAIAVYDNSVDNRMNPAPNKEVYWSEQSWDDMFLPSIRYTLDKLETKPRTSTQGQP
jgi:hypothetical protein